MLKTAAFIGILMVVTSSLYFLGQYAPQHEALGLIVWAPRNPNQCQGNFTGEAIVVGKSFHGGCSERWAILLPPSEHGNLSMQAIYLAQAQEELAGVFLDDFDLQNTTTQLRILDVIPPTFHGEVCPVLYPFGVQPNLTKGMSCILLAMSPRSAVDYESLTNDDVIFAHPHPSDVLLVNRTSVAMWLTIIHNATASIDAKKVILLVYAKPFSGWPHPIPQNYLTAMRQYAEVNELRLVYFK